VTPSILLVDDHLAIAQALASAFRDAGFEHVEFLGRSDLHVAGACRVAERMGATVALVDLDLGDAGSGLAFVPALTEAGVRTVVFTASNASGDLAASVRAGAVGFLNKSEPFDVIIAYVERAAAGEVLISTDRRAELLAFADASDSESSDRTMRLDSLTDRERQVLTLLAGGRTPKEIAKRQGTAVGTVRNQIKAIRAKLGVQSQLAAVALAREARFSTLDE
jgi:DNA-binding NarL/FixJ family response regulator